MLLVLTALWLAGSGRLFATDWTQFDFDSLHSGSNPQETTILAGNVALTKRRLSRNGRVRDGTIAKGLGHVRGLDHGHLL